LASFQVTVGPDIRKHKNMVDANINGDSGEHDLPLHTQLYLAIGIPTIALVLGMIGNGFLFNALSARMSSMENRIVALENRILTSSTIRRARWSEWWETFTTSGWTGPTWE